METLQPWDQLVQLAASHPEAVVRAVSPNGDAVVAPSAELLELFPHVETVGETLGNILAEDRPAVVGRWLQATSEGVASGSVRTADEPTVVRTQYIFNLIERLGVLVVVITSAAGGETAQAPISRRVRSRTTHCQCSSTGVILSDEATISDLLGYERGELVGRSPLSLMHPDDIANATQRWGEMLGTPGGQVRGRAQMRCADGSWVWIETTTTNNARSDGVVHIELVDVSSEMKMQSELRRREELLTRITSALPSGVAQFDANGQMAFANDRLAQIIGLDSAPASLDALLATVADVDHDAASAAAEHTLTTQTDADLAVTFDRPDGGIRHCRLSFRSLPGKDDSTVGLLCCVIDITKRWRLEQRLLREASTDALTGTSNRSTIIDALTAALRDCVEGRSTAVFFFDLDGFKQINDRLGHGAGDAVLRDVAERLGQALRPVDIVGRMGGDEFIVVARDLRPHMAGSLARRLFDAVHCTQTINGSEVHIKASCGYSLAPSGSDTSAESLIAEADMAMYEQKRSRTPGPHRYEHGRFDEHLVELNREDRLGPGIERGELVVHYQPVCRLDEVSLSAEPQSTIASRAIVGFEALVRWRLGDDLLQPADFVGVAERGGLINSLGQNVLEQVLERAATHAGHTWSINLSPVQLRDARGIDRLIRTIDESPVAPGRIAFEVTERHPLAEEPEIANRLRELSESGSPVFIDDFGSGHGSLSLISDPIFSGVKLSEQFVQQLPCHRSHRTIESIVRLAREFDLTVVAEGVETAPQFEALRAVGVAFGQGFLLGRPSPDLDTAPLLVESSL